VLQGLRSLAFFPGLAAALVALSLPALAEPEWMSLEAIRAEFVGKKLRGYSRNGITLTSGHHEGGRFEMCEGTLCVEGHWLFRGRASCIVSGPPYWALQERCFMANKISPNCYEFHLTSPRAGPLLDKGDFRPEPRWHSRAWRQEEPSTCEPPPTS
jgi:hypothetical protein